MIYLKRILNSLSLKYLSFLILFVIIKINIMETYMLTPTLWSPGNTLLAGFQRLRLPEKPKQPRKHPITSLCLLSSKRQSL